MPLSECIKLLEANNGEFCPFVLNFNRQRDTLNINQIFCLHNSEIYPFSHYQCLLSNPEEAEQKIKNFAKYAGPTAKNIIICL